MDPRRNFRPGPVNREAELAYLRAGADPPWERPKIDGEDVTDEPARQTPYQRERRAEFLERLEQYRAEGLLG